MSNVPSELLVCSPKCPGKVSCEYQLAFRDQSGESYPGNDNFARFICNLLTIITASKEENREDLDGCQFLLILLTNAYNLYQSTDGAQRAFLEGVNMFIQLISNNPSKIEIVEICQQFLSQIEL